MSEEEKKSNKKPKRRSCVQTKKTIKRISWYYRDGQYFLNKSAYKDWKKAQQGEVAA